MTVQCMTEATWRLDHIGTGRLAWFYVIPHAGEWSEQSAALVQQGYTVTEEAQSLVDDELGGCWRYLAMKASQR